MNYSGIAQLAPLTVAVPLIAAAILMPLSKYVPRPVSDAFAVGTACCVTVMCAVLTVHSTAAPIVYWMGEWIPRHELAVGIGFVIDPIGGGLATLAALLVTAALVFSICYFNTVGSLFHTLMLAFMAAMCGFALTGDLFNMFVWFELMGAAAFALTAQKIEEPESIAGAINFAITNSVGAFCALLGVAMLYGRTGALNMAQIGVVLGERPADTLVIVAFVLITVGFFVKGAVAPFHFWLDDAHAVAPTPVCILFSGVMVQLGLYAVARVYWACFSPALGAHAHSIAALFVGVGIVTAIGGAVMSFAQSHLKRMLAFSTVSHSGMFVCAIGLFNAAGTAAAALFVAAHGLIKAALFICAGVVLNQFGSLDERTLHGRGKATPMTAIIYAVGAFALAGLPPFGISGAKLLFDDAMQNRGLVAVAIAVAIATALDAAAVLRFGARVFAGWGTRAAPSPMPFSEQPETKSRQTIWVKWNMLGPAAGLLAVSIWAGIGGTFIHGVERAAQQFIDEPAYAASTLQGHVHAWPQVRGTLLDPGGYAINLAVCALAVLFAAAGLYGAKLSRRAAAPLRFLRGLHTGVYVDYIAYMMFGIAAYGVWLIAAR